MPPLRKSQAIDALRGFAILAVLQYHYGETFHLYAWLGVPPVVRNVLAAGWAGVDLFFVLSAYLLTRNLASSATQAGSIAAFYRRRLLRIMPLYLFLLATGTILEALLVPRSDIAGAWLWNAPYPAWVYATFLQNWFAGLDGVWHAQFYAPTWSLAVEEHFYLVLPLLALACGNRGLRLVAVLMVVTAPLLRAVILEAGIPLATYAWTICRLDAFGFGMLIALSRTPMSPRQVSLALPVAAALFVAMSQVIGETAVRSPEPVIGLTVVTAIAALAVFAVAHLRTRPETPSGLVGMLAWCGERCFSLYLLHIPVAGLVFAAVGQRPGVSSALDGLLVLVATGTTLAVGNLSCRWIERPFIAFGDRVMVRARSDAVAV